jgi:hypothetical protein
MPANRFQSFWHQWAHLPEPIQAVQARPLFDHRLFAETFAAFLRQNSSRWRLRRTDRFSPLDVDLAEREVTLTLRIDRQLLRDFAVQEGEVIGVSAADIRNPQAVTAILPVLDHPKRLLLQARQSLDGHQLPGLQRYDEARILARDLLARLYNGRTDPRGARRPITGEDGESMAQLRLVTSIALFNDPHRLKERLVEWCNRNGRDVALVEPNGGLARRDDLKSWIHEEAEEFLPNLGAVLLSALEPQVDIHHGRTRDTVEGERGCWITEELRPGGLAYFPTLQLLLLHGIQDVLKLVIETADTRPIKGDSSDRATLINDRDELAQRTLDVFSAIPNLEILLKAQNDGPAFLDFVRYLDRWISYAAVTFQPGVPFSITFSDISPLDRPGGAELTKRERARRLVWRTNHWYPLPLRDALSVHVEVVSREAEIVTSHCRVVRRERNGSLIDVHQVFGQKSEPSGRLRHRYSSKLVDDRSTPGVATESPNSVFLETRYKLLTNVKAAYLAASVTFTAAAAFLVTAAIRGWNNHLSSAVVSDAVLVGTLSTTLGLWLITTQYRVPVIQRKLFLARWWMYATVATSVAALAVLGSRRLFDQHEPVPSGQSPVQNQLIRQR